jgi:hypothetical protein
MPWKEVDDLEATIDIFREIGLDLEGRATGSSSPGFSRRLLSRITGQLRLTL